MGLQNFWKTNVVHSQDKRMELSTSTEIISDPGISNMASSRSFSKMALKPRAPVFLLMALRDIALSAPSVNVKST